MFNLKNFFKREGVDEFIVNGIYDFVPLLEEIERICFRKNRRYLASIGRNNKNNIQILHPRTLLDSKAFSNELKDEKWAEFGFGLYISDIEDNANFQEFKGHAIFKEFFPVKKFDDESTYFLVCDRDKTKISNVITLFLKEVFLYKDTDIAHVNFYYWSKKKEIY